MATEMINIKLDSKFLKEIDEAVKRNNYQSRTEYIREALRQKQASEWTLERLQSHVAELRKKYPRKAVSEAEYEAARKNI